MLTVTEAAKEELKQLLIDIGADIEEGLRLLPAENDVFVLSLDTEMSADQVVEFDGYKVLLVGIEYYRMFRDKTVDCRDTEKGTILYIQ
jgi:hypothetical protein